MVIQTKQAQERTGITTTDVKIEGGGGDVAQTERVT